MAENMKNIKELLEFSIINIDKPSGPTSFQISDYVKKTLGLKKTSHFGTLDPKVTGVLPVALSRACKLTGYFLGHNKTYIGIMNIHKAMALKKLQEIIDRKFTGRIKQLPPKRSRVKRQEREREILRFELLEYGENKKEVLFLAEVQGGTYIRKLVHDLGEEKEVGGAHMTELRRIRAGIFSEGDNQWPIVSLYEFKKAVEDYKTGNEEELRKILVPAEQAVRKIMPAIQLRDDADFKHILTGKPIFKKDIIGEFPNEEIFAVFFNGDFIEVAKKAEISNKEEKIEIVAFPQFVLQPREDIWKK